MFSSSLKSLNAVVCKFKIFANAIPFLLFWAQQTWFWLLISEATKFKPKLERHYKLITCYVSYNMFLGINRTFMIIKSISVCVNVFFLTKIVKTFMIVLITFTLSKFMLLITLNGTLLFCPIFPLERLLKTFCF